LLDLHVTVDHDVGALPEGVEELAVSSAAARAPATWAMSAGLDRVLDQP
jgi:hypothetical protein